MPTTVGPFPGLRFRSADRRGDGRQARLLRALRPAGQGWQDRAEEFHSEAALLRYLDVFETFAREVTGG